LNIDILFYWWFVMDVKHINWKFSHWKTNDILSILSAKVIYYFIVYIKITLKLYLNKLKKKLRIRQFFLSEKNAA